MGGTSIGVEAMELRYSFKHITTDFYYDVAGLVAESVVWWL